MKKLIAYYKYISIVIVVFFINVNLNYSLDLKLGPKLSPNLSTHYGETSSDENLGDASFTLNLLGLGATARTVLSGNIGIGLDFLYISKDVDYESEYSTNVYEANVLEIPIILLYNHSSGIYGGLGFGFNILLSPDATGKLSSDDFNTFYFTIPFRLGYVLEMNPYIANLGIDFDLCFELGFDLGLTNLFKDDIYPTGGEPEWKDMSILFGISALFDLNV